MNKNEENDLPTENEEPILDNKIDSLDILKACNEIKALITDKLAKDESKETIIGKLNDELSNYRDDFLFKLQKPIFVDLVMLSDLGLIHK